MQGYDWGLIDGVELALQRIRIEKDATWGILRDTIKSHPEESTLELISKHDCLGELEVDLERMVRYLKEEALS